MTDEEQDEQFYRDTESIAFPKLNDHQLSLLEPLGERRVMKRGDVLFKAGQRDLGLAIVLRGELEAFETRDGTEYNLATARERDFMGDVSMLQGTSILGSSRVTSDEAEVLYIPAAELRRALAEIPAVSKTIVDALIMRRRRLRRDCASRRCARSRGKPACCGRSRKKMKPKFSATWQSLALDRPAWPQPSMPHPKD